LELTVSIVRSGRGDLRLLVANGRFAVRDLGLFSGQLVLVPFSGGLDERRSLA
jgi:hypothetical protein